MQTFNKDLLFHVVSFMDMPSVCAFSSTCKQFSDKSTAGNDLWKHAFNSYNNEWFASYKGKEYFKQKITGLPKWYTPNSSHLLLFLYLKEMEKRGAQTERVTAHFSSPFHVDSDKGTTDTFCYFITPNGDAVQFYIYRESYENTEVWVILKQVNQKILFIPLVCIQYQHGAGWTGALIAESLDTSRKLLGMENVSTYDFLNEMLSYPKKLEETMSYAGMFCDNTWMQNISGEVHVDPNEDNLVKMKFNLYFYDLQYLEERSLRVFEAREAERKRVYRLKLRGPASDSELDTWQSFMYKADRGHKGNQFAAEWDELLEKVKVIPHDHLQHFVLNVRSDLGRTFLWCCASRGWTQEAEWALSFGADPKAEAGKGSAYDIAQHYKRTEILKLFSEHKPKTTCTCC